MEGDHNRRPLLREKHNVDYSKNSPNGRWITYVSDESGKAEVYVRPLPDVNKGKWPVSTSGGNDPLWSQDGKRFLMMKPLASTVAVPAADGPRKIIIVVNWFEELKQRVPMK